MINTLFFEAVTLDALGQPTSNVFMDGYAAVNIFSPSLNPDLVIQEGRLTFINKPVLPSSKVKMGIETITGTIDPSMQADIDDDGKFDEEQGTIVSSQNQRVGEENITIESEVLGAYRDTPAELVFNDINTFVTVWKDLDMSVQTEAVKKEIKDIFDQDQDGVPDIVDTYGDDGYPINDPSLRLFDPANHQYRLDRDIDNRGVADVYETVTTQSINSSGIDLYARMIRINEDGSVTISDKINISNIRETISNLPFPLPINDLKNDELVDAEDPPEGMDDLDVINNNRNNRNLLFPNEDPYVTPPIDQKRNTRSGFFDLGHILNTTEVHLLDLSFYSEIEDIYDINDMEASLNFIALSSNPLIDSVMGTIQSTTEDAFARASNFNITWMYNNVGQFEVSEIGGDEILYPEIKRPSNIDTNLEATAILTVYEKVSITSGTQEVLGMVVGNYSFDI